MKYIKLFEGLFNKDEYYIRIPSIDSDLRKMGLSNNYTLLKRFTEVEKKKIRENIPTRQQSRRVDDNIIIWDKYY